MLKIFVFEVFHIVIFFLQYWYYLHFTFDGCIWHSIPSLLAVLCVHSSCENHLKGSLWLFAEIQHLRCTVSFWEDWWCFWRHGLFTDPINAMDLPPISVMMIVSGIFSSIKHVFKYLTFIFPIFLYLQILFPVFC